MMETMGIVVIEDLKDFESLIVPLFFVPMGGLRNEKWFGVERTNSLHEELLIQCMRHSLHWSKEMLARQYFKGRAHPFLDFLSRFFVWRVERKAMELKVL